MIDIEQIPLVGRVLTWAAAIGDLLLNSGEFVFALFTFATDNFGLLFGLIKSMESLAERLPWVSAAVLNDAVMALLVAIVVIETIRLAKRGAAQL